MNKLLSAALLVLVAAQTASALTVQVLGRKDPVKLDSPSFVRHELPGGTAIEAIYDDAQNRYVVYQERSLYQHRCGVPAEVKEASTAEDRSDGYYEMNIDDEFDFTSDNTPTY